MTDNLAISVHGLTKSFGDRHAVDNLTFDLQRSNVTGFVGPNGAGKSTTIRMLLGLLPEPGRCPRRGTRLLPAALRLPEPPRAHPLGPATCVAYQ